MSHPNAKRKSTSVCRGPEAGRAETQWISSTRRRESRSRRAIHRPGPSVELKDLFPERRLSRTKATRITEGPRQELAFQ